ncbi:hypothetical protein MZO42_14995 [Sphingomonas psychrotolerans]|uniref:Uncharacterized protein n=1 Tax=Sphingomonas psychrotolerans TaxID=1327635 RepID=A0ABU3N883_9SPHN|nr:hypothetical protein [Sphingomonas psychrotolerans]MDT8760007.1 hypothetical protein [Sphingomonas psychrotolerans]
MKLLARVLLSFTGATLIAAPAAAQRFDAPPAPPAGAAPNQMIPLRDAQGRYATPNRDLSRDEASWHVRSALNVAALGCRDAAEPETVAAYNRLLRVQRDSLAAADAGVKSLYRARNGAGWEDIHDRQMTRVYNFFAQPTAHDGFCMAAREVLARAETVEPAQFADFAAEALPRLEAPFTDFYRAYDAYKVEFAAWQRGDMAPVAMAASEVPAPQLGALVP